MLNKIKSFFDQHIASGESEHVTDADLHLACAALLIEMMHMDDAVRPEEKAIILCRIKEHFGLSDDAANTLMVLAAEQRTQATDYYQFTSLINRGFSHEQKITLIKLLWDVAFADGELDIYEEHMVRKIADLLHVSHMHFIKTKHQADHR
ncbi:MAG TPA: TerB family tellurite resistance protein [Methylococcaceae bacterium]|jgi:uncharacterized tellurite resistance protein B-like protein|nr:TerB family tellurite resistance protein [Methylococcaceae bacterium]HIN69260.1 TerB family tellurite resistance protein [Methylococcales bacterium]HIA46305.1 TerB family tellurite resistance protein [Methylococcaceae bacterium]HIB61864.1 TerB family tellurite resistance protein [Methylococcaceae bacterium]HIO12281.1 TerB family tellurite resistance protein [Methylococcales bacterium]